MPILRDAMLAHDPYDAGKLRHRNQTYRNRTAVMTKPPQTLQAPSSPDPVAVVLDPATTALLIFDIVDPICTRQPVCKTQMVPAISSLLARARRAGVIIVYGTRAHTMANWLPEVSPAPGDIKIESQAQDRFYNTDLDTMLKAKGITTLILAGWKVSGSVTYTSVGATLRGYTVVVPVDASLDASDFEIAVGRHQILNQHSSNAANEPLKSRASTLSRTDLISFK